MIAESILRCAIRRVLTGAALLIASTSCIVVRRASFYDAAQVQPSPYHHPGDQAVVSGNRIVLDLSCSTAILFPAPDTGVKRRLLIELAPEVFEEGARLSFPSSTARAVFVLNEGPHFRSSDASGAVVVVSIDDAEVEVEWDARCRELEWKRSGRDCFVRSTLPHQP